MGKLIKVAFLLGILFSVDSNAEAVTNFSHFHLQITHQEPALIERDSQLELNFKVPSINANEVEEAYLFYRLDGEMAYRQKKATLYSSEFKVPLVIENNQATGVDYYFEIQLQNGERVTYPQNATSTGPVEVEVVDQRKTQREKRVEETGVDYTILSPEEGATVRKNDVVVALTLFYDPAEIDTAQTSFQLLIDGQDVTEQANASDYFYTYSTDELTAGEHTATFNLQKRDTTLIVTDWKFRVVGSGMAEATESAMESRSDSWMPSGKIEMTARNQQVGEVANDALSGNLRLSGQKGNISYSAHGLLTTQEDSRLQPQNRFGANLNIGDWLDLEAGHVYPTLSSMTIAGQRMQGLNAGLYLWDEALNFRFVYGNLRRGIDNMYRGVETDYQTVQQDTVGTSYILRTREGGNGTYERDIIGGRIGAGRGDNLEFGLNFLKVEDDTNSIKTIHDFNTLMDVNPSLSANLNDQQKQNLTQNPSQLNVNGNPRPKGNFVAASDMMASFDSDRIRLKADAAVSLLNQDISEGVLSPETAEDLGLSLDSNTENMLDQLSWLIIINENMSSLPFRFKDGENGSTAEAFFPTGILATQSELAFNYFDNNFKVRYRWVGPSYNSLANNTIRKDIAGINISDRIQMLQNRVYLTLGYENLNDNVINNKDATTNTNTYRGNLSWYPLDDHLPRVSLSFLNRNRDNSVPLHNPFVTDTGVEEAAAVQNFTMQQGDTVDAPNPRLTNTYQISSSISQKFSLWGATHNASMSYSFITTEDQKFKFGDSQSQSLSMEIVNRYDDKPMQTSIGFNYNNTETNNGLTDIQIFGIRLGGSTFFLDDKLNLNTSVAFTKNRSENTPLNVNNNGTLQETNDDYYQPADNASTSISENHSYIINAGGRYNVTTQHSILLNFRYSNVRNTITAQGIPNDHLLRMRYIYNF